MVLNTKCVNTIDIVCGLLCGSTAKTRHIDQSNSTKQGGFSTSHLD